jgi:hypothetical protein
LGHNTKAWAFAQRSDVRLRENYVVFVKVAGESTHLDVLALADNDGMKSVFHQAEQSAVRVMDQRTGRLDDIETAIANPGERPVRSAVGGNEHRRRLDFSEIAGKGHPPGAQGAEHGFVMHQITEDGNRLLFNVLICQRNGVADAKAHAQVSCAKNSHEMASCVFIGFTLYCKV